MEIYDLDTTGTSRLGNLSTRAGVEAGENVVIAGFIIGVQSKNSDIVVRGLAPEKTKGAALEVSLPPGRYTAILSGTGGTGVSIVEIYNKR